MTRGADASPLALHLPGEPGRVSAGNASTQTRALTQPRSPFSAPEIAHESSARSSRSPAGASGRSRHRPGRR